MDRDALTGGQPTALVGRAMEAARVRELLSTSRVVTLSGPGGVGKTRLAHQVMAEAAPDHPEGAHFVGLADLRDPRLLTTTVAQALGRSDAAGATTTASLLQYLQRRELLLVLDNCEHLVDEVADLVLALVADAPGVQVLTTSRRSLGLPGEQLYVVPPLAVPDEGAPSDTIALFDSVQLFIARARAVVPDLEFGVDRVAEVARLCRKLDGLPLAIELAAARMRVLSPKQITDRLAQGLALLTGGSRTAPERQQTMRAAIDGSRDLCSPAGVAVWARASVFAGRFDLEAAEAVCGGPDVEDVLGALEGLVDTSILVRSESRGGVRFRLLEPLREYGHELLEASGEAEEVQRRHRDWYATLVTRGASSWFTHEQTTWLRRLHGDHANLRAALDWSISSSGDPDRSLSMATDLHDFFITWGMPGEAREWIERALDAAPADLPGRARAYGTAAATAAFHADLDGALELAAKAEQTGDPAAAPFAAHARAFVALLRVEPGAALAAEAIAGYAAAGEVHRTMHPMFLQALLQAIEGDPEAGRATLARMIEICEPAEEANYRAIARFGQAVLELWFFDDVLAAAGPAHEALRLGSAVIGSLGPAYYMDALAWVASRSGRHRRAAFLFGAAAAMWDAAGVEPDIAVMVAHRHFQALSRRELGDDAWSRLYATGKSLPSDEATTFALDEHAEPPAAVDGSGGHLAASGPGGPLTPRESEIAALVAEGLTNRAIAEKLVIAVRTVDTHVQNILTKLDLRNRTQLAGWVAERRVAPTPPG